MSKELYYYLFSNSNVKQSKEYKYIYTFLSSISTIPITDKSIKEEKKEIQIQSPFISNEIKAISKEQNSKSKQINSTFSEKRKKKIKLYLCI